MPARNVVPKPVQSPHPPLWVACTNRETMKMAARLGMGALTFSFMDANEAGYWVKEYYDTFKKECQPIGRTVNPNIAMLAGMMVHRDRETALARGLEGQRFFKWGLAHYYRFGSHVPGRTSLWEEFTKSTPEPMAGVDGVGDPQQVRDHFRSLEEVGVDQLILLQQGGKYEHDHICESLELAGREVIPEFAERHAERERRKGEELAPYIEKALARIPPLEASEPEVVDAYPVQWQRDGYDMRESGTRRAVDAQGLWRMHVGGNRNA
jgi:alkanesulfonate monooxygenase SsuD/methylene tetrahydromethanopterin reductase-like flavin-dependent oxidoreductase (luciferase family)